MSYMEKIDPRDNRPSKAWLATIVLLALTLILALYVLREQLRSDCGTACAFSESVSRAPGP